MSAPKLSIAEFAEKELGIKMLPWQIEVAERVLAGETSIVHRGKQSGRSTLLKIMRKYRSYEHPIPTASAGPDQSPIPQLRNAHLKVRIR